MSEVADELFVVQENDTRFPGLTPGHYPASNVYEDYFRNVKEAEKKLFGENYRNYYEVVDIIKNLNISFIDLKNEFNKLPEPIDLYSKKFFHLNISGYKTAAELINEKIKEFEQ